MDKVKEIEQKKDWTTQDEIQWLEELRKKSPTLFAKYKDSMHLRTEWGNINKYYIHAFFLTEADKDKAEQDNTDSK